MNELKGASKSHLEWMKEHYTDRVKFNREMMMMNGGLALMTAVCAILTFVMGVDYAIDGEWVNAVFEFVLAALQGWLCFFSVKHFIRDRKDVRHYKAVLKEIDSQLEELEREVECNG